MAARARPDRVVLKDIEGYMRGREQGEVASILSDALVGHGVAPGAVSLLLSELDAAIALVEWAGANDVVVLPVHNLDVRSRLVEWLDQRSRRRRLGVGAYLVGAAPGFGNRISGKGFVPATMAAISSELRP